MLSCPVLIAHSQADELIKFKHGEALYAEANAPKEFIELGGGHDAGYFEARSAYVEALRRFVQRYL